VTLTQSDVSELFGGDSRRPLQKWVLVAGTGKRPFVPPGDAGHPKSSGGVG